MASTLQVAHYSAMALQAQRLPRRKPAARPTLAAEDTWQAERRNALTLLRADRDAATARADWARADALLFALVDLEYALRERAAATITESVGMPFAHVVRA